jgi:hypothetical protein
VLTRVRRGTAKELIGIGPDFSVAERNAYVAGKSATMRLITGLDAPTGHGPQYNLTRRAGGKTVTVHLKPGPQLEKAEREVAEGIGSRDYQGTGPESERKIPVGPSWFSVASWTMLCAPSATLRYPL